MVEDPLVPAARRCPGRPFAISDSALRGHDAIIASPGDLALEPTIACWSIVHGFVALIIDAAFFAPRCGDERARSMSCSMGC